METMTEDKWIHYSDKKLKIHLIINEMSKKNMDMRVNIEDDFMYRKSDRIEPSMKINMIYPYNSLCMVSQIIYEYYTDIVTIATFACDDESCKATKLFKFNYNIKYNLEKYIESHNKRIYNKYKTKLNKSTFYFNINKI